MQLLAMLIELHSISVAGKQIKKPIDIPRPGKKGKGGSRTQHPDDPRTQGRGSGPQERTGGVPASDRDAAFKQGISVLQGTTRSRR